MQTTVMGLVLQLKRKEKKKRRKKNRGKERKIKEGKERKNLTRSRIRSPMQAAVMGLVISPGPE